MTGDAAAPWWEAFFDDDYADEQVRRASPGVAHARAE
jgi:hypothetical protein